jgi:outer membrane protein OmpA-like peptidoglycan-associated protein
MKKIKSLITPATITDYTFGISSRQPEYSLDLQLRSDSPLTEGQALLLERMIGSDLGIKVRLHAQTTPFIPELIFSPGETALNEEMKKSLLSAKSVFAAEPRLQVTITSFRERSGNRTKNLRFARERAKATASFLSENCAIPMDRITTVIENGKTPHPPTVKVSLVPEQEKKP